MSSDLETTFSVDGSELVTFAFDPSLQSTIFRAGSLHMAAPTDAKLADPTLYAAYFDNLEIAAIPEPGSFVLLAGMLAAMLTPGLIRRLPARG